MRESLNATLRERVSRAVRPDWTRTFFARRVLAGVLVLLAAVSALRPDPSDTDAEVVVAAADLSPGRILGSGDVRLEKRSAATVPDGAVTEIGKLAGSTLAGPARRGEILTDARMLSPRLAGLSAGPDARVVPLRLADAAVLDVIRTGDIVDVLGAPASDGEARPRMLAAAAVVVLVSGAAKAPGAGGERVVLVALPATAATSVACAGLTQAMTLTIH